MSAEPFALYVHVPYCRRICPYCDFNVYAAAEPPERAYVAGLLAELATHAARAPWEGRQLRSIYVGGGTPSLFSTAAIAALLDAIVGRFGLAADAEVTLEANPGTVSAATLAGYRAAGVNRLSLGAQSFAAAHLHTLGRDHGPDDTQTAMAAARAAGFANVSLDLIYGVPGQDLASWERDLAAAIALAPEHVSAYALTYEPGTPFFAARGSGRLTPADDDLEADMAERTLVLLPAAGYARYEISSYARPGFASRHNASYWNGSDYLGLGAGAHSFARTPAPGRRWVNERVPARYLEAITARGTAVGSEEQLNEAQARGEFCLTGLRQTVGVDVEAFRQRFGEDLRAAFPHIDRLVADGLVELGAAHLRLTPDGFRHADTVAATFV